MVAIDRREFVARPESVLRVAKTQDVVVWDGNQPAFVIMRYDTYRYDKTCQEERRDR